MQAHFWPVFPAFWLMFWVAVAGLAVWARRTGRWGPPRRTQTVSPSPTAGAEQILAERYARGEIGDDEYMERMSVLRS
ncbi:SHOCT domain-containing protein [Nonomuraea typhae]|uniref:SHOCT domain-containing protein n=1 Tax=Nonomuraea typhae TaxID=2603600 RepID=UPI0012F7246A|nr:SHOCT domain-containing protein [Nonomuraea typhae]